MGVDFLWVRIIYLIDFLFSFDAACVRTAKPSENRRLPMHHTYSRHLEHVHLSWPLHDVCTLQKYFLINIILIRFANKAGIAVAYATSNLFVYRRAA